MITKRHLFISALFLSSIATQAETGGVTDEKFKVNTYVRNISISCGTDTLIVGERRARADIYLEKFTDKNGVDSIVANRLTITPVAPFEFTRPYLQVPTPTGIVVNWKTNKGTESVVKYGVTKNNLSFTGQGSALKLADNTAEYKDSAYIFHKVELSNLTPSTVYYYQVVTGEKASEVFSFKTQPLNGSKEKYRFLIMGDHQIQSRSGYEWLLAAAKRKIEEKYGSIEENVNLIMNIGDQVDVGTLNHYEFVHFWKSDLLSPSLPIMTTVGNHETYYDSELKLYSDLFSYEDITYKGISSGTENYYAFQTGRSLFIVLSSEHPTDEQLNWVQKVIHAAKDDESVDFVFSFTHRPIQAEQYIGDISSWVRNKVIPVLSQTEKHVLNVGAHHHLYHRGQLPNAPAYHIINGGASWDQMWGMSHEEDYDDVQKTIDYWAYQIVEIDNEKKEMTVESYAIGNREIYTDNILIDVFKRTFGQVAPEKPHLLPMDAQIELPYTFKSSPYATSTNELFNSIQFQISTKADFSDVQVNRIVDYENLFGSTGKPDYLPVDINKGKEPMELTVFDRQLKNGMHFIRIRHRDRNQEWSEWSDSHSFDVIHSIDGDPEVNIFKNRFNPDEEIALNYRFASASTNAWIGVYLKGTTPGINSPAKKWGYTTTPSGVFTCTLSEINEYYAVMFEDGGYKECSPRVPFYVGSVPLVSTDKLHYNVNEPIDVLFSNAPGLVNDWVGIYRMGDVPGPVASTLWKYVKADESEGRYSFTKGLPKGYYFVTYLLKGAYFEPCDRAYFSVGDQIALIESDQVDYKPGDEVKISFASGPGTPKDWIGFYREGKEVGIDELDAFLYFDGVTTGTVTMNGLVAGDYFVSLYINDSYEEVSNRIHITIGKAPVMKPDTTTNSLSDTHITIKFNDNEDWRMAINTVRINGSLIAHDLWNMLVGELTILTSAFDSDGNYLIEIDADQWQPVVFDQPIRKGTDLKRVDAAAMVSYYLSSDGELVLNNQSEDAATVQLCSMQGIVQKRADLRTGITHLPVQYLASGTYLLRVVLRNGCETRYKVTLF